MLTDMKITRNWTYQNYSGWNSTGSGWDAHVDFGVADKRGRRMGQLLMVRELTEGRGFAFRPHATRNGYTYGPVQEEQVSSTLEMAKANLMARAAVVCRVSQREAAKRLAAPTT